MMETILRAENLKTRFETFNGTVYAVNGVDFELRRGETLAVVGESGSGKSVTMLSLLGLLPASSAKVSGRATLNITDPPVDLLSISRDKLNKIRGKHMSIVFQDALRSLNPVLTVGEQISESLITHLGYSQGQAHKRAVELLEHVGIPQADKRYSSYPHQFSGGMRQRAMIAISIACDPEILIADEPTTALDVTIQTQITELTRRLQDELGMTVIWITHDLGVVAGIADRVMVMYAGMPIEIAPVDELYESPQHPYTEGLLGAIPEIGETRSKRLVSIGGTPPDLFEEPMHCQFAWRCPYVFDRCWKSIPPYVEVSEDHKSRCFLDMNTHQPKKEGFHGGN
ncbi:MAG: ABC transporter ATP-binding protein [Spirochaetaceae bacterium]